MRAINLQLVSEENKKLLFAQIEKLESLNHPHILKYHKTFIDDDGKYLYMII